MFQNSRGNKAAANLRLSLFQLGVGQHCASDSESDATLTSDACRGPGPDRGRGRAIQVGGLPVGRRLGIRVGLRLLGQPEAQARNLNTVTVTTVTSHCNRVPLPDAEADPARGRRPCTVTDSDLKCQWNLVDSWATQAQARSRQGRVGRPGCGPLCCRRASEATQTWGRGGRGRSARATPAAGAGDRNQGLFA